MKRSLGAARLDLLFQLSLAEPKNELAANRAYGRKRTDLVARIGHWR